MTSNKKLLMFAASGLLLPLGVDTGTAHAEVPLAAETAELIPSPENDLAPVSNGRLRRTDEEQEGNGMPTAAFFDGYKSGIYFSMNTELPPTTPGGAVRPATHRMQLAAIPFQLVQGPMGNVKVTADAAQGTFVTNNRGNEYRNANAPVAFKLKGVDKVCVKYNYQPNNSNDTKAYLQCFNPDMSVAMPQTELFAKNNDDAFMTQDGAFSSQVVRAAGKVRLVFYAGANGNGRDDGWGGIVDIDCSAGATCSLAKVADVSLCPREERSRGNCTTGTDPNTMICTWTEGNTQPQRDGVWMAAVNIGDGENGAEAQSRILWKKQIAGRVDENGIRTYAMRMSHSRIQKVDPTTGQLVDTDDIIVRWGGLQGNNNTNGKGGTYYKNMMGVVNATAAGMTYVAEPVDIADKVVGLDGTHLGMTYGMFGTTDNLMPGITFLGGSHTGGGTAAQARIVTYDPTSKVFSDAAMVALAPHDRHLYTNYLGNNPGNQGRNHSFSTMIPNPYVGMNGNKDAYLQVFATSGKNATTMMNPAKKLSAFLSVLPIAQIPQAAQPPGTGSGSGENPPPGTGGDPDETGSDPSGAALGGCSTGGSTGGLFGLLLIGLAAFIRRRR
ncbi:MAG: MYXO-CTERM sorting domain-containing protein [Kofleriaceae bacterium]